MQFSPTSRKSFDCTECKLLILSINVEGLVSENKGLEFILEIH